MASPGISMITVGLAPKRLELLHQLVPAAELIALLGNRTSPYQDPETKDVVESARAVGLQVQILNASTATEIDAAFPALVQRRAGALLVIRDSTASAIDSLTLPRVTLFRPYQ